MRTRRTLLALGATAGLLLAGCGDDSNGSADADGADLEAFCELNDELDQVDGEPTDAQLDRIVALAPDEIRDATETLADAVREFAAGNEDVLDDPAIAAADEEFDEFVDENCE